MHAGLRQASLLTAVAMTSAIVLGVAALAQSSDPLIGTWKLNVAKSTGSFKSGTTNIEAAGDGVKFTVDMVGTDGTQHHWTFTANYDGKDNPVMGRSPYGDVVALTRRPQTTRVTANRVGNPRSLRPLSCPLMGRLGRIPPRARTRRDRPSIPWRSTRSSRQNTSLQERMLKPIVIAFARRPERESIETLSQTHRPDSPTRVWRRGWDSNLAKSLPSTTYGHSETLKPPESLKTVRVGTIQER